jgi:chemotaxis signal transduction protein
LASNSFASPGSLDVTASLSDQRRKAQMSELHVEEFISYMPSIAKCVRTLRELNSSWRLIESTAKMVCPVEAETILPAMKSTRDGFGRLEEELITNLVRENIAKSVQEIQFRAKVIIDVVVRNLFERVADVGFLAMDSAIREFVIDGGRDPAEMVRRLREYRNKYTVYDEILILDIGGNVLAQLDNDNKISQSKDPLIAETLTSHTYVETFRKSDLRLAEERSLIYSRTITHPQDGHAIGVLCLCFPLAVEMTRVFASLRKERDLSVMLMLDRDGYVIASSDTDYVRTGSRLPMALHDDYEIVSYAGREYIAKTCAAQEYQGYRGPGWFGHVMIPCETAFRHKDLDALSTHDASILAGVMSHAKSFCPPLYDVMGKAETINVALRRVVWNGKIMSSPERGDLPRLKSILQEISQTGDETSCVFKDSIHDLYATVISSSLQNLQSISRLMIDIMDRNLYERANDCRWWALTPDIRRLMAGLSSQPEAQQRITQILEEINALYTSYARIVVFDVMGTIVAASDPNEDGFETVGRMMDRSLLQKTLALRDSQTYCVSEFAPTWLYADRPTYVYCAAVYDPNEPQRVVGGIGVVFDSEPEFRNMLLSSLPERTGAFAAFIDRRGNIVASTQDEYPPGGMLPLDGLISGLKTGGSAAKIIVHRHQYMMAGYAASSGYREFKTSDGYRNDITASVFIPIGVEAGTAADEEQPGRLIISENQENGPNAHEFATFSVNGILYGLPAAGVIEAVDASSMTPASTLGPPVAGVLNYTYHSSETSTFVPVVDMCQLIDPGSRQHCCLKEVIVVRSGTRTLGLLVTQLHDVLECGEEQIEPAVSLPRRHPRYVCNLIKAESHGRMIQVIDLDRVISTIFEKSH